jgi:hypothetical protein
VQSSGVADQAPSISNTAHQTKQFSGLSYGNESMFCMLVFPILRHLSRGPRNRVAKALYTMCPQCAAQHVAGAINLAARIVFIQADLVEATESKRIAPQIT